MFKLAFIFVFIACFLLTAEAYRLPGSNFRVPKARYRDPAEEGQGPSSFEDYLETRGSCIPLGATGCEASNSKCCRKGNPYTGTMRKCRNTGNFAAPEYTCMEA